MHIADQAPDAHGTVTERRTIRMSSTFTLDRNRPYTRRVGRLVPNMVVLSPPELPTGTDGESAHCHAIIPRQFSVWPFGMRNLRLLLLLDPSRIDAELLAALLRAMQYTCFRSETGSHTNAVRAAVLAAHYVLQHHNHDALPHAQVTAGVAVAIRRGSVAYVALAGDAAALAWRSGRLSGQRTANRSGRPLGLDAEPRITLWSTPLRAGDRLI